MDREDLKAVLKLGAFVSLFVGAAYLDERDRAAEYERHVARVRQRCSVARPSNTIDQCVNNYLRIEKHQRDSIAAALYIPAPTAQDLANGMSSAVSAIVP